MSNSDRKTMLFMQREQDILNAALELFDDEQWEKVTVAQIAQHTGIGKGTVYKHFSCKEDIYARLILDDAYGLLEVLQLIPQPERAIDHIRLVLEYSFKHCLNNMTFSRLHMYCKQKAFRERVSEEYQRKLIELDERFMELCAFAIEKGIADGSVVDLPRDMVVMGMRASFDGALMMIRNRDFDQYQFVDMPQSEQAFVDKIIDYMLAVLQPK